MKEHQSAYSFSHEKTRRSCPYRTYLSIQFELFISRKEVDVILGSHQLFYGNLQNRRHRLRGCPVHQELQAVHQTKQSRIRAGTLDETSTLQVSRKQIQRKGNIHRKAKTVIPTKCSKVLGKEQVFITTRTGTSHTVSCQFPVGNATPESGQSGPEQTNARAFNAQNIMNVEFASRFESLVEFINDGHSLRSSCWQFQSNWWKQLANHRQT